MVKALKYALHLALAVTDLSPDASGVADPGQKAGQPDSSVKAPMAGRLRTLVLCERYHPERHYMRGPGPKSLARRLRDE